MRAIFSILLVLMSLVSSSQWKSFIISVRGDTLNRVDMQGRKQGPWVIHVDELRGGNRGMMNRDILKMTKRMGVWVRFSLVGDKIAAESYRWGALDGKAQYFNRTGSLVREENWRAVDPNKTLDTVPVYDVNDPSKVIDQVVVKLEARSYKHGTWTYYDPEWGTVVKTEQYFLDKIKTDENGGEELKPIDVTGKKEVKKPQAVLDYEKKNSGKKKIKSRDGSTGF